MPARPSAFPIVCLLCASPLLSGQGSARSESSITQRNENGDSIVEIRNTGYELAGNLVLRKTLRSREVVGDKEMESEVHLAAWPLASDLAGKPLYDLKAPGTEARTRNGEVWIVEDQRDPDVSKWTLYSLKTGKRLFQTYVDPLEFGISRADGTPRYAGLEIPPDDASDPRLRAKTVVGVLIYAAGERVLREVLISCDNPDLAAALRSYFDEERSLTAVDRGGVRYLQVTFRGAYPNRPHEQVISVPVGKDDLGIVRASAPPGLQLSFFTR